MPTNAKPASAVAEYQAMPAQPNRDNVSRLNSGLTLKDACHQFLQSKEEAVARGELASRSYLEYSRTCQRG
jgi:hypothetical protein